MENNKNVKHCPLSVITFLNSRGNLISDEEHNQIVVLEKALELACERIFLDAYPSYKKEDDNESSYRHDILRKHYKSKAKKILGEKGE